MDQRAFLQYLRSLQQSGLRELPAPTPEIISRVRSSLSANSPGLDSSHASAMGSSPGVSKRSPGVSKSQIPDQTNEPLTGYRPDPTSLRQDGGKASLPESEVAADSAQRLAVLDSNVKACTLCPDLASNRTQTVFGVGNPDAQLCFLGEAPGADEDRQGEPFVGAAGQLLNRMLKACHLSRDDVYILNTIKCRPPGNRNPADDECDNCRPFLDQQLGIIQPEFICCLGGIAATQLLQTQASVGRLRGKLHDFREMKVLVTYHPAYLLLETQRGNIEPKRKVWEDLQFLMKAMGRPLD